MIPSASATSSDPILAGLPVPSSAASGAEAGTDFSALFGQLAPAVSAAPTVAADAPVQNLIGSLLTANGAGAAAPDVEGEASGNAETDDIGDAGGSGAFSAEGRGTCGGGFGVLSPRGEQSAVFGLPVAARAAASRGSVTHSKGAGQMRHAANVNDGGVWMGLRRLAVPVGAGAGMAEAAGRLMGGVAEPAPLGITGTDTVSTPGGTGAIAGLMPPPGGLAATLAAAGAADTAGVAEEQVGEAVGASLPAAGARESSLARPEFGRHGSSGPEWGSVSVKSPPVAEGIIDFPSGAAASGAEVAGAGSTQVEPFRDWPVAGHARLPGVVTANPAPGLPIETANPGPALAVSNVVRATEIGALESSSLDFVAESVAGSVAMGSAVSDAEVRPKVREEKIAVRRTASMNRVGSPEDGILKTLERVDVSQPANQIPPAGIGSAKSEPVMPFPPPELVVPTTFASAVTDRSAGLLDAGDAPTHPDLGTQAARAVEAVFTAAELARHDGRSSVTLRFAMGEADLSVRVEVRQDEVHAIFSTESAELRAALTQECAASTESAGRSFRFSAQISDQGGAAAGGAPFSGDSGFARREPHRPPQSPEMARLATHARSSHDEPRATSAAVGIHGHSHHLHTLA